MLACGTFLESVPAMVVQFDILSNICLIFFQKKSVICIVKTNEDKKSNFPCFVLAEQVL